MRIRTEEAYVQWARRFILFHQKHHPADMGPEEIRAFLTHLAVEKPVAASTQNVALQALRFLYGEVLKQSMPALGEIAWNACVCVSKVSILAITRFP